MKALRFDLEIPFWCSFGDFSSLNIKLSYRFPPLTTLFGLIQNALGKEALHNIDENKIQNNLKKDYINDFNHLKFSIIINDYGEMIEDYVNIHKGSREKENYQNVLKKKLDEYIKDHSFNKELKEYITKLKNYSFYEFLLNNQDEKYKEIYDEIIKYDDTLIEFVFDYWNNFLHTFDNYNINKVWLSTQINRQRLIEPKYSIYILSDDDGEFSLENIMEALINPKRPLYIGESDDVVDILNVSLVDIKNSKSSLISSIIPGLYSNSELIKIPTNLKYNLDNEYSTLCSIPKGDIGEIIKCYEYDGENFVFI